MFDVLGLKPQAGVNFKGPKQKESVTHEALKKMAPRPAKKKKEVVGDGEEIEVDENDEEVLSTNDINSIYKKSELPFSSLVYLSDSRNLERSTTTRPWVRWSRLIHSA
jgi:hypothetical protein